MTKIALSPNPNGTGTLTIAAPDSDNTTTVTLPANTGELLTNSSSILQNQLPTLPPDKFPAGSIIQVQYVRFDSRVSISAPSGTTSTEITQLSISITPKKSNSLMHCQWYIHGEASSHNTGFRVRVNGVEPTDGYNQEAGNQTWSVITSTLYDGNDDSTPRLQVINYFHTPGGTIPVTYSPSVKDTGTSSSSFRMNRTDGSLGTNDHENGVSWGIVYEIAQ